MSIKYSEILASDEVLSAGANDIIVLAIVDGGSPTGYTTKAIKTSNLLSGSTPNLQTVIDTGSTYSGAANVNITTSNTVTIKSDDGATANAYFEAFAVGNSVDMATISGANVQRIIFDLTAMTVEDTANTKGLVYAADYSANFTLESLVTKRYVDSLPSGTSIYNANGNTSTATRVVSIQDTLSFRDNTGVTPYLTVKNTGDIEINALSGRWNLGIASAGNTNFRLRSKVTDTYNLRIETSAGLIPVVFREDGHTVIGGSATAKLGIGIAISATPTALVQIADGDVHMNGNVDTNLFHLDESTDQLAFGSTPYADVKFSFTNTTAKPYTLVVLNSDTTKNFQIMETGVIATNGQLALGVGTAPSSTSSIITAGDIEIAINRFMYYGDPTTDGSYRQGNDGLGNFITQERIAGVWTTIQTL